MANFILLLCFLVIILLLFFYYYIWFSNSFIYICNIKFIMQIRVLIYRVIFSYIYMY